MALPADASLYQYPGYANARTYDAEFDRLISMCYAGSEGIAPIDQTKDCTITGMGSNKATDLEVLTNSSGLQLSVTAGQAWVRGDYRTTQGLYFCRVPTAEVVTLEAAHATLPRIDAIILQVTDADIPGDGTTQWDVTYAKGTATAGATLTNLTGAPTIPNTAMLLAYVLVPAAFVGPFVTATHIQDRRFLAYRPGRRVAYLSSTSDSTNAGDKLGPVTFAGNGVNPMYAAVAANVYSSGAAGTNIYIDIRDAASGAGTVYSRLRVTSAGVNYGIVLNGNTADIAAFSGQKSLYMYLNNNAGVPTVWDGTNGSLRFIDVKYV